MKRFKFFVLLFGLLLIAAGLAEFKLRLGSSDTPTEYSVAALEKGGQIANRAAVIDSHYALYPALVFSFMTYNPEQKPTGDELVHEIWYPIISEEQHAHGQDGPPFHIVVREQVREIRSRDLPKEVERRDGQRGMFLDGFHSLGSKERQLLQSSFPNVDFTNVLLFQIGRQRMSMPSILGLIGLGLLLIVLAGRVWFLQILGRRKKSEPAGAATGSRSLRSETNQTSGAAGSGRSPLE